MSQKTTLRAWTFFRNGIRIHGAHEFTPPALAVTVANMRTGAQDSSTPVDDGLEPMTCQIKFYGIDLDMLASLGYASGSKPRFTAYEGYVAPGISKGSAYEIEGFVSTITPDARGSSGLSEAAYTIDIAVSYVRHTVDGRELFEVDTARYMRRVGGVDMLAGLALKVRL